jgi:hypothetical protein
VREHDAEHVHEGEEDEQVGAPTVDGAEGKFTFTLPGIIRLFRKAQAFETLARQLPFLPRNVG